MEDVFLPVFESAVVIAGYYAKACERNTVLPQDVQMGLMFAARHVLGKQIGSLFPEIYEEESDSDEASESSESEEHEWTRYEGEDERLVLVNKCADEWDAWEPETPAERAIKSAVEKVRNL